MKCAFPPMAPLNCLKRSKARGHLWCFWQQADPDLRGKGRCVSVEAHEQISVRIVGKVLLYNGATAARVQLPPRIGSRIVLPIARSTLIAALVKQDRTGPTVVG